MKSEHKKVIHKKTVKISLIIIFILATIFTFYYVIRINNYMDITQFEPSTSRQMMGYAIKTINNKIIIIDGGTQEDSEQLLNYIKNNGSKVDCWIITHPHIDHAGAFEIISQNKDIQIDKIYMSIEEFEWYENNEQRRIEDIKEFFKAIEKEDIKEKITEPNINDIINIDNIKINILGIKNPEITTSAINNSSMVFKMCINNKSILFLGDTQKESSEKLIKNQGKNLKSEIVQVSHHGQNGATEELYKIVSAEICLWPTTQWLWDNNSNGAEDSGPWKTKETRKWMEELKVKQNYIAKDGTHTIRIF